jgi:hypothetical protein
VDSEEIEILKLFYHYDDLGGPRTPSDTLHDEIAARWTALYMTAHTQGEAKDPRDYYIYPLMLTEEQAEEIRKEKIRRLSAQMKIGLAKVNQYGKRTSNGSILSNRKH